MVVVILALVRDSMTSPISCQARALFRIYFLVLTCHDPKAWIQISWVSIPLALVTSFERVLPPDFWSLGSFFPGPKPSFVIDHTSHVSFQRFYGTTIFEE